jgi:hypothetical protein
MATPGIPFELTEETKQHALRYVEDSGLFKNRLSAFLGVSRPTLDRLLDDNPDFFTQLQRADAIFCKSLIESVKKRNPIFILKTKYRDEFNEVFSVNFDPETAIQKVKEILEQKTSKNLPPLV